jgi:hypothetical protein
MTAIMIIAGIMVCLCIMALVWSACAMAGICDDEEGRQ